MPGTYTRVQLHEITGLGRPLDFKATSNRLAIAGSAAFGLIAAVLGWGGATGFDLIGVALTAVAAFLGWALGRELDPDSGTTALVAMGMAGVLALVASPQLLAIAVLLLVTRVLAGTVGSELRALDYLVLIGAAAVAGSQPVAWPIAALLVFAFVRRAQRLMVPTAITMGLVAVVSAGVFVPDSFEPGIPSLTTWLVIVGLIALGWRRISVSPIRSSADNGSPIEANGVGLARLATLAAIAAGALLAPDTAILDLGPAVAAFAAVAIVPRRTPKPEEVLDEPPAIVDATLPPVV